MKKAVALGIVASFAVMSSFAPRAHAESWLQFEAGVGVNVYQTMGDGTWQQEGAPYSHVKLIYPAAEIGVRKDVYEARDWGVTLHVDYAYLGQINSDCYCTTDQNYDVVRHRVINPHNLNLSHFVGSGNAQGVAITVEPYYKRGEWRFGVEGGLFPYRPQFDEVVTVGVGGPGQVINAHTPNALQLGLVVGASVERGNFGLSFRHYFLQPFGTIAQYPPIYNDANVIMATYRF